MTLRHLASRPTGALAALVTGVVAGAALTVGAPATAAPLGLPTGSPTSSPTSSPASAHGSWGKAVSHDHVLRHGCHSYDFRYAVTTPASDWMAEIKLISPVGRSIATHTFTSNIDPRRATSHFRVCSPTTKPGRQEIRMRVTSYTGPQGDQQAVRTSKPTHFRFTA